MSHPGDVFLTKRRFGFSDSAYGPVPFARKSLHPTLPRTPCTFACFSCLFVCLVPSFRLFSNDPGSFSQRTPCPPPAPPAPFSSFLAFSFVLFLSSGWLGGIQARVVNARPNTPSPPGRKKEEEKEKRKKKKQNQDTADWIND